VDRREDGLMFVTPQADLACTLAPRLVDAFRDNPATPPAKVGSRPAASPPSAATLWTRGAPRGPHSGRRATGDRPGVG
jgi:hypothetical protein